MQHSRDIRKLTDLDTVVLPGSRSWHVDYDRYEWTKGADRVVVTSPTGTRFLWLSNCDFVTARRAVFLDVRAGA